MPAAPFTIKCFPKTVEDVRKLFHNEETSLRFLFSRRWPKGFECSYCNWINKEQQPAKTMTCSHCGHPTSITTNTIMHGTKKPLSQWLVCIWWFTSTNGGHSAKDLQRLLNLSSYQTAWTWLQKLRMAMALSDNKQCQGTVEIYADTIKLGGDSGANATIIAATEFILSAGITGRIKMESFDSLTRESIKGFLARQIQPGSSLILPDIEACENFNSHDFITITSSAIYRTREILQSFEIWLNKIHRGGVVGKHLQLYLNEFCFRSNAAMLSDKESVFNLLLSGVISRKSLSYKNITAQPGKE